MRSSRLLLLVLPLALASTGCTNTITGIWMMQISYPAADTCVDTISHNFTGATVPSDTTDTADGWTQDDSETRTDELTFVQVETTGKDTAVLIMGSQAWPGTMSDKGHYTFAWSGSDEQLQDSSHDSGYTYTYSSSALSEEQLVLVMDQGLGSGTWESTSTNDQSWLESDTWSKDLPFARGAIPAGDYLVVEGTQGKKGPKPQETPASNGRDDSDCDADNCTLTVTTTCDDSLDVVLTQTDFSDDDAYSYLGGSGQNYGAH